MAYLKFDVGMEKDLRGPNAGTDVIEPCSHLERISRLRRDETWLLFFVGILDILERG